jgi:hypothetical protein
VAKLLRRKTSEQIASSFDTSRGLTRGAIRNAWNALRRTFWPTPAGFSTTRVDYAVARSIYMNDNQQTNLAGFGRAIIDLPVNFIGLPSAASGDEVFDDFINDCIHNFWAETLTQMKRNTLRDSRCVVRIRKPASTNPLMTQEEREACYLEILPPESVEIFYNEADRTLIDRAYYTKRVEIVDSWDDGAPNAQPAPRISEHVIIEEVTPEALRYYDQTQGEWLTELEQRNTWGFVPFVEVFNEFDSTIDGGQSDLETAYPFILAFHEALAQALAAHKYHSIPKAKFKIVDIQTFLANNFPDSFDQDENGQPIPGTFSGTVSWRGTEILFFEPEEDGGFMEAKSVLGDSKVLLDFLLDCICISSELPRWAFNASSDRSERNVELAVMPLKQKIERKRINFKPPVQDICKMVLKIVGMEPRRLPMTWTELSTTDLVNQMQALQQLVMAVEVATTRGLMSDQTGRQTIRPFVPAMKDSQAEARDAKGNVQLLAAQATQNGNSPNGVATGAGVGGKNE